MRYNLYQDNDVKLDVEEFRGVAYLHCEVLGKFTVSRYKKFLVIFTAALETLKRKYTAVRAMIQASNNKLARFAEMFQFEKIGFTPKEGGRPSYHIYEVQRYG